MIENMTDESIYEVYRRAVQYFDDGAIFAEVGVYYGNSVLWLAKEIMVSQKHINVFAVDNWDYKEGVDEKIDIFKDFVQNIRGFEHIIWPLRQDSLFAAQRINGSFKLDFVYIDADHNFNAVLNDILAWKKIVKKDGWIAGHDWQDDGVQKAVKSVFDAAQVEVVKDNSWLVVL